jgi:glycosyltransferase involved in cell wall biosynthesis
MLFIRKFMPPIILDARTATDHFPGIGRYVVNLAGALKQIAPDLDLTLLRDPSSAAQRLTLPDLPMLDCATSPFALSQQWRVRSILRQTHATLYHSPYYLMPYRPGVPAVFTCHDLIPLIFQQYFTTSQRLIYRFTHQLALRTARLTIAVSQSTKDDLQRFFRIDPDRVVVVHEGVDGHFRPPSRGESDRVKELYALPPRYVLYFGSNKPHKNVRRLIQAFAQANLQSPTSSIQLVIAGHWDERYPEAKHATERLGLQDVVRFLGPVQDADLPALYGGAELFVFPSEYEGFGLPVLEAMACGTPVVCSNRSSLPEVAGDAALLCDPHDVEALARAIEQALADRDLRSALQQRGLNRAAQFSWGQTAQQTQQVYRSLLEGVA